MTPAYAIALSVVFALAHLPTFIAGFVIGRQRGYQEGHRQGWQAQRFAYGRDGEVTKVVRR